MKNKPKSLVLRILTGVYTLAYLALITSELISYDPTSADFQMSNVEMLTLPLAFIIFFIGFIYTWFNEKVAGIIFLSHHLLVWVLLMMVWPDAGLVLVLVLPVLIFGVFFIRNWYRDHDKKYKSTAQQWKLSLRILLINYALVYLVIVVSNALPTLFGISWPTNVDELANWDYTSPLGIILLFALVVFIAGFMISWKRELYAGILFIFWYVIILYATFQYLELSISGPWFVIGMTILLQGIFYIKRHFEFRSNSESG